MRVRAFTNRGSTTKVIGKFPSSKTGKTVWWESQLERDMIYLLEFDKNVLSYREQPLRIKYISGGRWHKYTPDFLVFLRGEKQIVEVKYELDAAKPENVRLFNAVTPVCREDGYSFVVRTETYIRQQPYLDNIKLLTRYSRVPTAPRHVILCYEVVQRGDCSCLGDAITFFEKYRVTREVVYALIYHGKLLVDLTRPLHAASPLSPQRIDETDQDN